MTSSQQPAITIGGRPGWSPMHPSDVQLARQVRAAVHQMVGRSRLTGTQLDRQALALVKTQHRGAVEAFGEAPIMALTRRLSPGACSWCACRILYAADDTPLPKPTAALRVAGQPVLQVRDRVRGGGRRRP